MLSINSSKLDRMSCVYPSCHDSSIAVELFNVHLAWCRRNWRGPVSTCVYNSSHIVPAPEEAYHSNTCQDRRFDKTISLGKNSIDELSQNHAGDQKGKFARVDSARGRRQVKNWNVGPRFQKQFEKMAVDVEKANTSKKKEPKKECNAAPIHEASCSQGNTRGMRGKNSNSYVVGRGGGRRYFRDAGVQRDFFDNSFRQDRNSVCALPTSLTTTNSDSDSDRSTIAMSTRGFRPWCHSKSFFNKSSTKFKTAWPTQVQELPKNKKAE